ncbi:MAG TPA: protein translocase subunit SecF, partial [bacterium]|nr:protein translocase subunit SecF [bacterium]
MTVRPVRAFDIIGRRRWWYALSLAVIVPGLIALYVHHVHDGHALNWGVDFTGGNALELRITQPFTVGDVRGLLGRFGLGDAVIQKSGDTEVFIRTRPLSQAQMNAIIDAARGQWSSTTMLREDTVGPEIGAELRNVAILGVAIGLVLQVIFISIRFRSVRFAIAADIALLHDLLVVIGAFALTQREVNSSFLAVLLTVAGYSINDTIVIFDRIRENLGFRTREPFEHLVNRSVLEALVRSINTAMTAVLAIGAVYVFGGETIRDVAFGLVVSIVTGGYSSIFNASCILVDWHNWADRRAAPAGAAAKRIEAPRDVRVAADGAGRPDAAPAAIPGAARP